MFIIRFRFGIEKNKAIAELFEFKNKIGAFGDKVVWETAKSNEAWKWWSMYGYKAPVLQGLAMKVLSQTTSASACERNWSAYNNILSKKRNRLGDDRCKDLVYVFTNQRLFDTKKRRQDPVTWIEENECGESESDGDCDESVDELIDLNFTPHVVE